LLVAFDTEVVAGDDVGAAGRSGDGPTSPTGRLPVPAVVASGVDRVMVPIVSVRRP
jgi:hypothetical protein